MLITCVKAWAAATRHPQRLIPHPQCHIAMFYTNVDNDKYAHKAELQTETETETESYRAGLTNICKRDLHFLASAGEKCS